MFISKSRLKIIVTITINLAHVDIFELDIVFVNA